MINNAENDNDLPSNECNGNPDDIHQMQMLPETQNRMYKMFHT